VLSDPDHVVDDAAVDVEGGHVYIVSGVRFTVLAERVMYYDRDGRLITESLTDYTRKTVQQEYATLSDFLRRWSSADRKQVIIDELRERGVLLEALDEAAGRDLDPFDLICHVAFDQPALTRKERADNVRKRDIFFHYADDAREVIEVLLDKYSHQGVEGIGEIEVLKLDPFPDLGTPIELVRRFGGRDGYRAAIHELDTALYDPA
jgi:type I restriction enzyme R subunit